MSTVIHWLETVLSALPLPLLEVWGGLAYVVGFGLMLAAFGGFTFRLGNRWGLGRERQAWDSRAVLSIPITFISIIVTGYLGSFVVLVPGAQTLESLKDLVVFLAIVLFGYPALITVPFAYGLSDLIEGVPPDFLLDWLAGYFINPACFWMAYQLLGMSPDFRRARTWGRYLVFVLLFLSIEPILWGYLCSNKFTSAISYRNITPALFFTTILTWTMAPLAMLVALPVARRLGMFWAEIPGHVRVRALGSPAWIWEAGPGRASPVELTDGWPIRMVLLTPFIAMVLLMVGATAYVSLRSAEESADKLANRLHQEISDNIDLRLDDYLAHAPPGASVNEGIADLLKSLPLAQHGLALIVDRSGRTIASLAQEGNAIAARAIAGLKDAQVNPRQLQAGHSFRFDHITEKPLSRVTWLARATAYQDRQGGHADWIVLTLMPESYYLSGVQAGHSRSALVFALALVLALTVAALLAGLVTARLRRLSLATQALAQGNLTQRAPHSRLEELDALARAFNHMGERLQLTVEELRQEVETRKVRERELEVSEARVRASENRLQLAVRAARFAIWDWDIENDVLDWDPSMYQLHGVSREEFGGTYEAWLRCLDSEDLARTTADIQAALRGEREFSSEFKVRLPDRSVRILRGVAQTLRDGEGRPRRMVGINWDVTEQRTAERHLRDRETFLRLAQEAAHVGSWEWDMTTNRVQWSDELARIHGLREGEFDGSLATGMSFCHPQDHEKLRSAVARMGAGENVDGFECRIVRRDGVERDLWYLGQVSRDQHGVPAQILGIAIDITERKRRDLLLAEETRVLGLIATGAPLSDVLTAIVRGIESLAKDTRASIVLLDPDGIHMRHGAAPSLPEEFNRAIAGAVIGPRAGSCGTALQRRETVVVSDTDTDPLWEDHRALARRHGLRACWSAPIRDSHGKVFGTFAMYYGEPRSPGPEELELIQRATRLAGVAMERRQAEDENRKLMHDLDERIKELTCLHRTAAILQDHRLGTAEWLERICLLLPAGWQFPPDTAARVRLGDLEFASPGFRPTPWSMRADFVDASGTAGLIEVVYLVEKPASAEGPFLAEERHLIQSLAEMLRGAIDRRLIDEALRASEMRLRHEKEFTDKLTDSLPGILFLSDATGTLLKWNKALEQVTGYEAAELSGKSALDFVPAEDAAAVARSFQEVLTRGQDAIEAHVVPRDGKAIPYFFRGVRLGTEQGPCVLGVGIDISERRRLEEQFRQAQKMEAVGHLAAGVAHDFNNLLTVISGYSELLLAMAPEHDASREGLHAIHEAGERAASLTRQLLAFSRQTVLQPKVLDVNGIVRDTEKMLRRTIGEDIQLTPVLARDASRIKVDPGQLGQVLINLAVNARDAMPQGGKLTIETANVQFDDESCKLHPGARPGRYVRLAVRDTGCGMTPEVKARVFDPFFTTKEVGKGTGLGLAMVYGMVQQSGGHIDVDTEVGQGTTFKLYFPAIADEATSADPAAAVPARRGTETILLVEDEEGVRALSRIALQTHGYQVLVAVDGKDGLRVAREHGKAPDLLVTDVVMPGLSGRELADSLHMQAPAMRVLFISGYTNDAIVRHGLLHDQIDFLQKPYTPATLAKKVREVLDRP